MNEKMYIHELVDIIGAGRGPFMDKMLEGFSAKWAERRMKVFGVWATIGSTGRWPVCVNIWELEGWKGLARNFAHETDRPNMQDPVLKAWWEEAVKLRSGGLDRIVIPAPYSPTVDQNCASAAVVGAKVFYHEIVQVAPRKAGQYLDMMAGEWLPVAERLGINLVGAFRTAYRNDAEVIAVWSARDWDTWGAAEEARERDPGVARWRDRVDGLVRDSHMHLMCSAPLSPTQTGRQP
jgi:hypothetical protein